jgi:hypothetical protein
LRSFAAKIFQTVENDREFSGRFSLAACAWNYLTALMLLPLARARGIGA